MCEETGDRKRCRNQEWEGKRRVIVGVAERKDEQGMRAIQWRIEIIQ